MAEEKAKDCAEQSCCDGGKPTKSSGGKKGKKGKNSETAVAQVVIFLFSIGSGSFLSLNLSFFLSHKNTVRQQWLR